MVVIINILVVLALLLGIIAGVLAFREVEPQTIIGRIMTSALCLLVAGVVTFVFVLIIIGCFRLFSTPTKIVENPETSNLKVLNGSDSGITGRFYLGSGVINSVPSIQYIAEKDDGAIKVKTVAAENATIYEKDIEQPTITTQRTIEEIDFGVLGKMTTLDITTYDFVIPKESIQNNYDVMKK